MTPARYDFFYAIRRGGCSLQSEIRRELGVSGATVSKMIKRLKELGLVRSRVAGRDGRHREIVMTDEAHALFARATRILVREAPIKRAFTRCYYGHATVPEYRMTRGAQIEDLERYLDFASVFRAAYTPYSIEKSQTCPPMLYRIVGHLVD